MLEFIIPKTHSFQKEWECFRPKSSWKLEEVNWVLSQVFCFLLFFSPLYNLPVSGSRTLLHRPQWLVCLRRPVVLFRKLIKFCFQNMGAPTLMVNTQGSERFVWLVCARWRIQRDTASCSSAPHVKSHTTNRTMLRKWKETGHAPHCRSNLPPPHSS